MEIVTVRFTMQAEPFFHLLHLRVRSLLSMRGMLLGYSFEHRPNSRVLATAGSVMTIGLLINGCSHLKKRMSLTRESKVDYSAATSKVWRDSGRASFSPPHSRRQNETLLAGWVRFYLWLEVQERYFCLDIFRFVSRALVPVSLFIIWNCPFLLYV